MADKGSGSDLDCPDQAVYNEDNVDRKSTQASGQINHVPNVSCIRINE
jgi:hypothetical protein